MLLQILLYVVILTAMTAGIVLVKLYWKDDDEEK